MRIINGKYRSRRIVAPKNLPTRPTTDMAKEALFNMLNNEFYFEDLTVLDLFSGTGNISYEFASRGTEDITSVDQNMYCTRFIQATAEKLGIEGLTVHKAEVIHFLERHTKKYDVIYADPPYDYEEYDKVIELVFDRALLKEEGVLILEHDRSKTFEEHPKFRKHKRYGHVNISFFDV